MNSVLWTQVNQSTTVNWIVTRLMVIDKKTDRQAERLRQIGKYERE